MINDKIKSQNKLFNKINNILKNNLKDYQHIIYQIIKNKNK